MTIKKSHTANYENKKSLILIKNTNFILFLPQNFSFNKKKVNVNVRVHNNNDNDNKYCCKKQRTKVTYYLKLFINKT